MKRKFKSIPKSKRASNHKAAAHVQAKFQQALASHQKGQLAQAQVLYEEILKLQPKHFDALHLLGVIAKQTKNPQRAVQLIGKAIEINSNNAAAYNNRGNALIDLKQPQAALESYDRAIAIKADYAEAYNNRGIALRDLKQPQVALESYDRAIALKADYADAYFNRGNALRDLKQPQAALESYDRAIALKAGYADVYNNRGVALRDLKQHHAALESFDQAIALKADYAEAYYNRGNALRDLKQPQAALESYDRTIALKADYAEAYNNRGNALRDLKQNQAALESYDRAIALKADYAEAYNNRGNALRDLNQHQAALESYERTIALKADYAEAYNNRGVALKDLKQHQAALESYDRALAIRPEYSDTKYNKSLLLLSLGRFEKGWEEHEWRWKEKDSPPIPDFGRPLWLGETSIQGKHVLLWGEQGAGDSIQFLRYVPQVTSLAAEVSVRLHPTLTELAQRSFNSVKVIAEPVLPVKYDSHSPLVSLALALRTFSESDIPGKVPYLTPDPEKQAKWRKRIGKDDKPLVGITWRGNPQHKNDHNRSISFDVLRRLLEIDQIRWVILQKPLTDTETLSLRQLAHCAVVSAELTDYDETAAVIAELDLIISVDTSVAHVAGALGKPVWVLLPYAPDWRWLLDREDSPWYPTARLFRQPKIGDWESVIRRVGIELRGPATTAIQPS